MQVAYSQSDLPRPLNREEAALLKALVYFDIFRYPLTLSEMVQFAPEKFHSPEAAELAARGLETSFIIKRVGEFWSLHHDYAMVTRRLKGNSMAEDVNGKAQRMSAFIHKFPFVRSVNISGSLSKNYFDAGTDIDYFIITAPDRIWLCRTLLALYKKIFLLNRRKYFCINYFISSEELDIPDKNLFAATEILTLRNMTGSDIYARFLEHNQWAFLHFPNAEKGSITIAEKKDGWLKRRLETMLSGKMGQRLDDACFRLTFAFWQRKFSYMRQSEFKVNLRSKKQVSKHHPQGFQFKVMQAFEERCRRLEQQYNILFPHE